MKIPTQILAVWLFCTFVISVFRGSPKSSAAASSEAIKPVQQQQVNDPASAEIYQQRCAVCHDNAQDRIPPRFLIARRSAEDVMQTLTSGSMKQQASGLTPEQIRALAIFLTGK